MEYIIDTSSWISLIRYYKPFDSGSVIYDFFKRKIENNEFIILNEVSEECSYFSQGMVVKELDFIKDKRFITKPLTLESTKKFYNLLDNQFCNTFQKRSLEDFEIEQLTDQFVKSADAKIITTAMTLSKQGKHVVVITEETIGNNDNKLFKKIPSMCSALDIDCIKLPELISRFNKEIAIIVSNSLVE